MTRVQINNVDHADLRVVPRAGAAFGDAVNQAPIVPAEFEEVQREFPIVFRRRDRGLEAFALLGLDKDENLSLDGDRWTSRYVPAMHRRGPFSIGVAPPGTDAPGEPMVHLDVEDPRVGRDEGFPLFLEHGGNAPFLEHITGVLGLLYDGLEGAPAIVAALDAAGLLTPVTLTVDVTEELQYTIPDVLVVDGAALAALEGPALAELHRSGLLRLATLALASLGTVSHLIARKQAVLSRAQPGAMG